MGKNTILCEVRARDLAAPEDGPIYTCLSLTWTYRLDGAGDYVALFPARDPKLRAALLKDSLLRFEVGGRHVVTGIVDKRKRQRGRSKDTLLVSGTCLLGALGENTVGDLELTDGSGLGVDDGPAQVLLACAVSFNTFTLDTVTGYATTLTDAYRKFSGESGLSALVKIAEQIGEHFRAATDGSYKVVWMRTDTLVCPIRLVDNGGPTLHRNKNIAIIEDIESDENAERSINRIYPFGAGQGDARLTLADATLSMPAGYTMSTANNYIEWDDGQVYPSTRRSIQKSWSDISVVDNSVEALIRVTAEAAAGATSIAVEALEVAIPSGATLDVNGKGFITVTTTANAAIGATSLAVSALSDIIFDFDRLLYSVPIDPANYESAANALASAALAFLGRLADPTRLAAYRITARNVPDTVHVGQLIPVVSQANGFEIDDNLIIREIARTVASSGRAPVQLRVSVQDWYETDEGTEIARAIEEGRVARASTQPIAATAVTGGVTPGDIADLGGASAEAVAAAIGGAPEQTTMEAANKIPLVDTGVLKWISWTNHLASLVASALTWLANVTIASVATTGSALKVIRDLAAASTDAPVVDIVQDNTGDDQAALRVTQDGTGAVAELYDGATAVVRVLDGGEVKLRRDATGNLLTLSDLTITEAGQTFPTGFFAGVDLDDIVFMMVRDTAAGGMFGGAVDGDTFRRIVVQVDGTILIGDGASARDTNLYRSAADTLKTDDEYHIGKYYHWAGQRRVSAQFDKTNATLASVTGLSVSVEAGKAYYFKAVLHISADATGGHKVAISGTATATSIIYQVNSLDNATDALVIGTRLTSLGGAGAGQAGATEVYCVIEGQIIVNAAGTLLVQFAQNAASGTSSVLVGSTLIVNLVL